MCGSYGTLTLSLSICCHIAQAVKAFVFELCDLFSFIWTNDKNSCTPTFALNLAELAKIICEWAKQTHTCYNIIFHIFHFYFNIFNWKFSYRSLYFDTYEKKDCDSIKSRNLSRAGYSNFNVIHIKIENYKAKFQLC